MPCRRLTRPERDRRTSLLNHRHSARGVTAADGAAVGEERPQRHQYQAYSINIAAVALAVVVSVGNASYVGAAASIAGKRWILADSSKPKIARPPGWRPTLIWPAALCVPNPSAPQCAAKEGCCSTLTLLVSGPRRTDRCGPAAEWEGWRLMFHRACPASPPCVAVKDRPRFKSSRRGTQRGCGSDVRVRRRPRGGKVPRSSVVCVTGAQICPGDGRRYSSSREMPLTISIATIDCECESYSPIFIVAPAIVPIFAVRSPC